MPRKPCDWSTRPTRTSWSVISPLQAGNGIELIEQIKARDERIKTLVSSMHDEALSPSEPCVPGPWATSTSRSPWSG